LRRKTVKKATILLQETKERTTNSQNASAFFPQFVVEANQFFLLSTFLYIDILGNFMVCNHLCHFVLMKRTSQELRYDW